MGLSGGSLLSAKREGMKRFAYKAVAIVSSIALALSISPLATMQPAWADESKTETTTWAQNIDKMLDGREYTEGEAIVVIADTGATALASVDEDGQNAEVDLLSGCESIFEASASSASIAFDGAEVASAFNSAVMAAEVDEDGSSNSNSNASNVQAEEMAVHIVVVHRDDMTTKEILNQLANDPRVISAEPNYISYVGDSEASEYGNAESVLSGASDASGADSASSNADSNGTSATNATSASEARSNEANEGATDNGATEGTDSNASSESASNAGTNDSGANSGNTTSGTSTTSSKAFKPGTSSQLDFNSLADMTNFQWSNSSSCCNNVLTGSRLNGYSANIPNWNASSENSAGVIATVDSGIDYDHPDLVGSMYSVSKEVRDRIGGGEYGYNATYNYSHDETKPLDGFGHGTHVAGIIAAQWNNQGTSGAANGVKLLACKSGINESGSCGYEEAIKCYEYLSRAIDEGVDVRVINNSWGSESTYGALNLVITELGKKGAISVFASGNNSKDVDTELFTSSSLVNNPYAVVVNSTSPNSLASVFSNYGKDATDLYAPGAMIMSTYCQKKSQYYPYFVNSTGGNAAYDTFDGSGNIEAYLGYGSEAIKSENKIELTDSGDFHWDESGALSVTGAQLKSADRGEQGEGAGKALHSYALTFKIPVSQSNLDKVSVFGYATTSGKTTYPIVSPSVEIDEGNGTVHMVRNTDGNIRCNNNLGWTNASNNLSQFISWAQSPKDASLVWHANDEGATQEDSASTTNESNASSTEDGYVVVSLELMIRDNDEPSDDEKVYFDCMGLGNSTIPYTIMSGTSMAAPLTTAAASICSTTIDQNLQPQERALELAELIKSCVTQDEKFTDKCTSNGYLDLSKMGSKEDAQAVISDATLEEGTESTIVISGANFGEEEKVTVGGYDAQVLSWTDKQIVVRVPSQLTSGWREVVVTNSAGKTCTGAFSFRFTQNIPENDVALFEETISLEGLDCATTSFGMSMIGLNGNIYAIPYSKDAPANASYHLNMSQLYCYNIESGSWTHVGSLPKYTKDGKERDANYGTVSLALWQGKIIMLARSWTDSLTDQVLFSYDPQTNQWTELTSLEKNIPYGAALVNADGTMMVIGGGEFKMGEMGDEESSYSSDNIATLNMQTGEVAKVGSLVNGRSNHHFSNGPLMQLAVSGDTIYVSDGVQLKGGTAVNANLGVERLTKQADGTYKAEDLKSAMPETKARFDDSYGLAAGTDGAVITALKVAQGDQDTFAVDNDSSSFTAFNKKASDTPLTKVTALAYHGKLYALGIDESNEASMVLRATAYDTPEHPAGEVVDPSPSPEPSPSPDPSPDTDTDSSSATTTTTTTSSDVLAKTGDTQGLPFAVGAVFALVALATLVAVRRFNGTKVEK